MVAVAPNIDRVAVGFAVLYAKLWSPTTPAALPPDTLAAFEHWGDGWIYTGATSEGWRQTKSTSKTEIKIEEQSTPVDEVVESAKLGFTGDLAEDTLQSITFSYGTGSITTIPAGAGQPGVYAFTLGEETLKFAVGVELKNSYGFPRRIVIPKASAGTDSETALRRAEKRVYPTSFQSLVPMGQLLWRDIFAAATS